MKHRSIHVNDDLCIIYLFCNHLDLIRSIVDQCETQYKFFYVINAAP